MKPRSFIRALGDYWDIVSAIWSRYETRTLTERELLHIVRPFTIGTDQPEQVAVKRMVDIGILSEFSRGGQGYSLNLQIVPFVQFLLDEQSLGLIEEISANANRLEGHLEELAAALLSGRRTGFFAKSQEMQSRFQTLRRMVESNTGAIYALVDKAKRSNQGQPLAERYEQVIKAWDEYVTPALQMKSMGGPFDLSLMRIKRTLQEWQQDPALHLLSMDDARYEIDSILFRMLDLRESLNHSIENMASHLAPLVRQAQINARIAQGAALGLQDLGHHSSQLARSDTLALPPRKRRVHKPDQNSLQAWWAQLKELQSIAPDAILVRVPSAAALEARERREMSPQMLVWLKSQQPVEDVVAKLMAQYPKARPDSVLRVLTRLTMEDKTAPFIQRHDDMQHYRFEDLEIRMNRRSYNAEPAPRRLAPIAFYSHYEPLPIREPADG